VFERRSLDSTLTAVRDAYAPETLVLDTAADFETLPPETAEELGLLVDALDPASYPTEWLPNDAPDDAPNDAPEILKRYAGTDFTIGMPGDGTVVWTDQTDPPVVLVKKRAEGTPDAFLDFLLAEAFVKIAVGVPEHFLPFFGDSYPELASAAPVSGTDSYQLAAALFDAWIGLHTREVFASWGENAETTPAKALAEVAGETRADGTPWSEIDGLGPHPALFDAWVDAGERLEGRLGDLSSEIARGTTSFPAATEYACSAVKHGLALPAPFGALDTVAYREHGAPFAVKWVQKTYEQLSE
jgi:hypothetical protein